MSARTHAGLNVFVLKCIAVTTMLIDHIGVTFAFAADTDTLRIIGRMAFPIFAFLIAEGCRRTRNIHKYALRLGLFVVVSELPHTLLFETVRRYPEREIVWFDLSTLNIFLTLFLGVCAIYTYQALIEKRQGQLRYALPGGGLIVFFIAMGTFLRADYQAVGVAMIFACYFFKERLFQVLAIFAAMIWLYADIVPAAFGLQLIFGGGTACVLLLLYNEKKGFDRPFVRWLFYAFYPLHLLVLFGIYYAAILSAHV